MLDLLGPKATLRSTRLQRKHQVTPFAGLLIKTTCRKMQKFEGLCSEVDRRRQDSNLRGQSPVDFESTSLTTRTHRRLNTQQPTLHNALPELQHKRFTSTHV